MASAKTKGYGQFCPVAKAAEVLSERWSMIIIRELLVGVTTFNDLKKGVPLISPTLLSERLRSLERLGMVIKKKTGLPKPKYSYNLTEAGGELGPIIMAIGEWGNKWLMSGLKKEDYDPRLLMWDVKRRIDIDHFKGLKRYVTRFDYKGVKPQIAKWWLIVDDGEADMCMKDPGHEVDLYVSSHITDMVDAWMGKNKLVSLIRDDLIEVDGKREDVKSFPGWFGKSVFA